MNVIDNITQHYSQQGHLVLDVPEWGSNGQPLKIHFHPMTMAEVNLMQKIAGKKAGGIEQAVNIIIVKAKDASGNRIFKLSDRETLLERADYKVISRIAEKVEEHFFGDVEAEKGNSEDIPADTPS